MELQPEQREQFHRVLSKNFTHGELKKLSAFALNTHLEEITISQNLSEIALELINWAEAKSFLQELIAEALKISPRNSILQELMSQISKTFQIQQELATSLLQETEIYMPVETRSLIENSIDIQKEPIDISTKRHLKSINRGNMEQKTQYTEDAPPLSPLLFPLNTTTELRNHINAAREAIQNVHSIFSSEKEVFRDQCRFSIKQVQVADESIGKGITESIQVLYIHTPAHSLLELEQSHFCEEASKIVVLLQEFTGQTSSLLLRKKIWEKLQLLMRSLQDSNALIDTLLEGILEDKVDN